MITTSFPRFCGDPAGCFVFGLARELVSRGHLVEIIAPEAKEPADWGEDTPWLEGVRVFAAPYIRPRRLSGLFYGAGVPDNLKWTPALAGLIPSAVGGLS